MANIKDLSVTLRVTEDGSLKLIQGKMDKVSAAADRVSNSAFKAKRNMDGLAQRTGSAGKDFARLSQGMGGVVQAYATVAAQVFALTAAYGVLKGAADFRSMEKSTENLTATTGRSFKQIAITIQEATKGTLNYQEAMESANKIGTTGLDLDSIEKLSSLAAKAAQTFGGTSTDAINRFVGAIQKGETELVKQVGIALNLQQTLNQYAASLGTTADQLSVFQRQQALANAILQEGERVLGGVEIDANPYEQLGAKFQDIGIQVLQVLSILDPFLNTVRDSGALIGAFILALSVNILTKAVPALTAMAEKVEENVKRQAIASAAIETFKKKELQVYIDVETAKTNAFITNEMKRQGLVEKMGIGQAAQGPKAGALMKGAATGFQDAEGKVNIPQARTYAAKVKAAVALAMNESPTPGQKKAVPLWMRQIIFGTDEAQKAALKESGRVALEFADKAEKSFTQVSTVAEKAAATAEKGFGRMARSAIAASGQIKTSMATASSSVQEAFLVGGMSHAWKEIGVQMTAAAEKTALFGTATQKAAKLATGLAGGLSFAITGLTKVAGIITGITIAFTILTTAWGFLKPILFSTNKEVEKFNKTQKRVAELLEDAAGKIDLLKERQAAFRDETDKSSASLIFLTGALQDMQGAIFKSAFSLEGMYEAIDLSLLESGRIKTDALTKSIVNMSGDAAFGAAVFASLFSSVAAGLTEAEQAAKSLDGALDLSTVGSSLLDITKAVTQGEQLAKEAGFGLSLGEDIVAGLNKTKPKIAAVYKEISELPTKGVSEGKLEKQALEILTKAGVKAKEYTLVMSDVADITRESVSVLTDIQSAFQNTDNAVANYSKSLVALQTNSLIDKGTVNLLSSFLGEMDSLNKAMKGLNQESGEYYNFWLQLQSRMKNMPPTLTNMASNLVGGAKNTQALLVGFQKLKYMLETIGTSKAIEKINLEISKLNATAQTNTNNQLTSSAAVVAGNQKLLQFQTDSIDIQIRLNKYKKKEITYQLESQVVGSNQALILKEELKSIDASNEALETSVDTLKRKLNVQKQLFDLYKKEAELRKQLNSTVVDIFGTGVFKNATEYLKTHSNILNIQNQISDTLVKQAATQLEIAGYQSDKTKVPKDDETANVAEIASLNALISNREEENELLAIKLGLQNYSISAEVQIAELAIATSAYNAKNLEQKKSIYDLEAKIAITSSAKAAATAQAATTAREIAAEQIKSTTSQLVILEGTRGILEENLRTVEETSAAYEKQRAITVSMIAEVQRLEDAENIRLDVMRKQFESAFKQEALEKARGQDKNFLYDPAKVKEDAAQFGIFFGNAFEEAFSNIRGPMESMVDSIVGTLDASIDALGNAIVEGEVTIKDVRETLKGVVRDYLKEFFSDSIKTLVGKVASLLPKSKTQLAAEAASAAVIAEQRKSNVANVGTEINTRLIKETLGDILYEIQNPKILEDPTRNTKTEDETLQKGFEQKDYSALADVVNRQKAAVEENTTEIKTLNATLQNEIKPWLKALATHFNVTIEWPEKNPIAVDFMGKQGSLSDLRSREDTDKSPDMVFKILEKLDNVGYTLERIGQQQPLIIPDKVEPVLPNKDIVASDLEEFINLTKTDITNNDLSRARAVAAEQAAAADRMAASLLRESMNSNIAIIAANSLASGTPKVEEPEGMRAGVFDSPVSSFGSSAQDAGKQSASEKNQEKKGQNITDGLADSTQDSTKAVGKLEAGLSAMGTTMQTVGKESAIVGKLQAAQTAYQTVAQIANTAMLLYSATVSAFGYADGGIKPAGNHSGPNFKTAAFAKGGVVTGPTMSLMGEAGQNEAVVPLPNNREIPVDLKGGTGDTINVTSNYDFTNADPNTMATLRAEAKNIEDRAFNRVFSEMSRGGKYAKLGGRRS